MRYHLRIGPGSVMAAIFFIPLLIFLALFIPALIITVLLISAAAGAAALMMSKVKSIGKQSRKSGDGKTKAGKVIEAEFKVK